MYAVALQLLKSKVETLRFISNTMHLAVVLFENNILFVRI